VLVSLGNAVGCAVHHSIPARTHVCELDYPWDMQSKYNTKRNNILNDIQTVRRQVEAPFFIRLPFSALCWTLDVVFANRPIQRRVLAGQISQCNPPALPSRLAVLSD